MLLEACLNGPRLPFDHPALPASPRELARDSAQVAAAGVGAIHVHVKDISGVDTLDGEQLAAVLIEIRATSPGLPVGVTTGAWAVADPERRAELVHTWPVLPDFASVNWHEPGAVALAEALLELGVGVEAGLWHSNAVQAWLSWPGRSHCLRALIEIADGLDPIKTVNEADLMLTEVSQGAQDPVPVLLHGEGSSCWPALRYAAKHGLVTRIGLEDTLQLPDGSPAPDNLTLVHEAVKIIDGSAT
jgi:uncharacterized protein (DUF849 family)